MIHYHGAPMSGGANSQLAFSGKHAMVSYAAADMLPIIAEMCQSFCIDNGAFSAWTKGDKFDLRGFAEFIETWYRHPSFDFYIMPDVIDGGVNENQVIIAEWFTLVDRSIWKRGVPVWHFDEPISKLKSMTVGFDMIALGSSGEYSTVGTQKWWGRMAEAMQVLTDDQGRPVCKIHGLRMLDPDVFSHIPLYSADSTNVARNAGTDSRWKGAYVPTTTRQRCMVMMDRIEGHASAKTWRGETAFRNWELFG